MLLSLDGIGVVEATIRFPIFGPSEWTLYLAGEQVPSGAVTMTTADGATWSVTIKQGTIDPDRRVKVKAYGGKAKLDTVLYPSSQKNVIGTIALATLLADAGEVYAPSSLPMPELLPHFPRVRQSAGETLRALLPADWTCRSLSDGTTWVGKELWPDSDYEDPPQEENESEQLFKLQPPSLAVMPGQVYRGKKIREVVYTLSGTGWRAVASYREGGGGVRAELEAFVKKSLGGTLPYLETSLYTVVAQRPDGTLDLKPSDDENDPYLPGVPVVLTAGMTVKVMPGTKAHVVYLNGKATAPAVVALGGNKAIEINLDAVRVKAGESPVVKEAPLLAWIVGVLIPALATPSPSKTVSPPTGLGTLIFTAD